jgi:hypothetical protein
VEVISRIIPSHTFMQLLLRQLLGCNVKHGGYTNYVFSIGFNGENCWDFWSHECKISYGDRSEIFPRNFVRNIPHKQQFIHDDSTKVFGHALHKCSVDKFCD